MRTGVLASCALALLMLAASLLIYRKGLGTTFFFDEWAWVVDRRPWRLDMFLTPYNGNLHLIPVAVFKVLFVTAGLGNYWIYRLVLLAFHLVCVALLFAYARDRVGDAAAVVAAAPVLFLGAAWHDLLVPFQIGFVGSVAAGLLTLIAVDRRTPRADVVAALALAVSIACSTLGLAFAAGAFVELLVPRARWHRLWIALAPALLYAVWYVDYRDSPQGVRASVGPLGPLLRDNLPQVPSYMSEAAAASVAALLGVGVEWGRPIAVVAGLIVIAWLLGSRPVSPRFAGLLAAAFAYWALLAVFRAQQVAPSSSRYIYGGAVLIVLVALELVRDHRPGTREVVALAAVAAFAVLGSLAALRDGSRSLQDAAAHIRAEFGALELAGHSVDPNYIPDPGRTQSVRAGSYLQAVRDLGSPAETPAEIARQREPIREEADSVLVHALGIVVKNRQPGTGGVRPTAERVAGGILAADAACLRLRPAAGTATLELILPPRGLIVQPGGAAPTEYRVRYFGSLYPQAATGSIPGRTSSMIQVGRARRALSWHLQLSPAEPIRVCGVEQKTT